MNVYTVKVRFSDGEVAYVEVTAYSDAEALENAMPISFEIIKEEAV